MLSLFVHLVSHVVRSRDSVNLPITCNPKGFEITRCGIAVLQKSRYPKKYKNRWRKGNSLQFNKVNRLYNVQTFVNNIVI